jgi:Ran GTPase-activating protein (RanGAP) involved in mRNA processing and transport
MQKYASIFIYL